MWAVLSTVTYCLQLYIEGRLTLLEEGPATEASASFPPLASLFGHTSLQSET